MPCRDNGPYDDEPTPVRDGAMTFSLREMREAVNSMSFDDLIAYRSQVRLPPNRTRGMVAIRVETIQQLTQRARRTGDNYFPVPNDNEEADEEDEEDTDDDEDTDEEDEDIDAIPGAEEFVEPKRSSAQMRLDAVTEAFCTTMRYLHKTHPETVNELPPETLMWWGHHLEQDKARLTDEIGELQDQLKEVNTQRDDFLKQIKQLEDELDETNELLDQQSPQRTTSKTITIKRGRRRR